MSDLFTLIIGLLGMFVVISGAAYMTQSSTRKNGFFTTPPNANVKAFVFMLGLFFLALFVIEFLISPLIHIIIPILAAALFAYTFSAEKILDAWENRNKK
jgi:ABC-type multidrug transport system fused ATPase/permease subunit